MSDCVFCKIIAGEIPSHKVYEDDKVIVIMDIGHVNPGHSLVIVKDHVETLPEADEDLVAHAFRIGNRVAKAVQISHPADGLTILQANRPAGFQTVAHLHFHVLPRFEDDGVKLEWPAKNPSQDDLAAHAEKIRAVLEA